MKETRDDPSVVTALALMDERRREEAEAERQLREQEAWEKNLPEFKRARWREMAVWFGRDPEEFVASCEQTQAEERHMRETGVDYWTERPLRLRG